MPGTGNSSIENLGLTTQELRSLKALMSQGNSDAEKIYDFELNKRRAAALANLSDRELIRLKNFASNEGDNIDAASKYSKEIERRRQHGVWTLDL